MAYYPLNIELTNRLCVIIGGGNVAARKTTGLLDAGAKVRLISPQISTAIEKLQNNPNFIWLARPFQNNDLDNAFLVYAATNNKEVQQQIALEAAHKGVLLNSANNPATSDFHVPAHFRRGEVLITAATGGKSPALAANLRKTLEETVGNEYGITAELLGLVREMVLSNSAQNNEHSVENSRIFKKLIEGGIVEYIKKAQWQKVEQLLKDSLYSLRNTTNNSKIDTTRLLHEFLRSHDGDMRL